MKIIIDSLVKKYGDKTIFNGISFSFSNEIIGLLGQSGSGKTTLLRILSGLENFERGRITIDNKDIKSMPTNPGILLQDQELIKHLNVFNNISFMIEKIKTKNFDNNINEQILKEITEIKKYKLINNFNLTKVDKQNIYLKLINEYNITPFSTNLYIKKKGRVELIERQLIKLKKKLEKKESRNLTKYEIEQTIIKVCKLTLSTNLLFKKPSELSFGEALRIKLSIALIKNPPLLLLDEPTSNLDPILKNEIIANIRNVYKQIKIPIIYVTHSFSEANKICSKLLFISDGKIEQFDSVKNIINNPKSKLVEQYISNN